MLLIAAALLSLARRRQPTFTIAPVKKPAATLHPVSYRRIPCRRLRVSDSSRLHS